MPMYFYGTISTIYPRVVSRLLVPTDVSSGSLQLWFDANDPNNTGVKPANNSTIAIWKDKSGGARDATANSSITYNTTGLNNLPALTFNASKYLTGSLSFTNNKYTFFAVFSANSTIINFARLMGFNDNTTADSANFCFNISNVLQPNLATTVKGSNPPNLTVSAQSSFSTPYLYDTYVDGSSCFVQQFFNNSANTASFINTGNYTNFNVSNFAIASYSPGGNLGTYMWDGYISEIIFYNNILSTTDRQKIEGYLAWKWGLQGNLPSNHLYKTAAPTTDVYNY